MSRWGAAPQPLQILLLLWPASVMSAGLLFLLNGSLAGLMVVAMVAVVFGLFLVFNIKGTAEGVAGMVRPPPKKGKGRKAKQSLPPASLSKVRIAGAVLAAAGAAALALLGLAL